MIALSSYLDDGRSLPRPSKAKRGQPVVVLLLRAAIKLAMHGAMCEQGVTQVQLGEMLGIDGRQVRRILNLDHESKLSQLDAALAALGLRASVRHGFAIPHRQDDGRGAGRAFEAAGVADAGFALDDAEPILLIGELRDVLHAQQWLVARARIGDLDQSRSGRRIEQESELKISEPSPLRLLH